MLPPNDLLPTRTTATIAEIPPDTRPNPPSISQIPSQNHDRTPTPTPTPVHPHAHTHARPIAHTPVRTRPRATDKIASHERKGASKAPKTGRIIPPSAHNPCFSTIQAICAPQQHPCATSDMHTHANTSTHTETQHVPQAHKHHAPHTEHDQTHTPAHRRSDVTGLRRR